MERHKWRLLILVLFLVVIFVAIEQNNLVGRRQITKYIYKENKERRYVYFDLGTNNGDSLLRFFNLPNNGITDGNLTMSQFDSNVNWIAHAYEANPKFNQILADISNRIVKKGYSVNMNLATAAWTYDGAIDFYLHMDSSGVGSSLDKTHRDVENGKNKVTVACKEIASVLKQYDEQDLIVLKMDIEGAEYDLLIDLLTKDALKLIDFISVEYHPFATKYKSVPDYSKAIIKALNITFLNWFEF
jgi:FkbM family methyltransferase